MRAQLCECGKCPRCRNREHAARYRAKRERDGVFRVKCATTTGPSRAHMSLKELRAAAARAIRDDEIRAYGPQYLGSTLDPAHIFSLRESRSK